MPVAYIKNPAPKARHRFTRPDSCRLQEPHVKVLLPASRGTPRVCSGSPVQMSEPLLPPTTSQAGSWPEPDSRMFGPKVYALREKHRRSGRIDCRPGQLADPNQTLFLALPLPHRTTDHE